MPTLQLIIKGKVQGVFYRSSAKKIAEKLSVSGWIKNMEKGDVEAIVTGSEEQLQQFIAWCKKGTANAKVEDVIIIQKEDILFNRFEIVT